MLAGARDGHEKTTLQRQIDKLVYWLYGLSHAEIVIVEGVAPLNAV